MTAKQAAARSLTHDRQIGSSLLTHDRQIGSSSREGASRAPLSRSCPGQALEKLRKLPVEPVGFQIQNTPTANCQIPNCTANYLEPTVSTVGGAVSWCTVANTDHCRVGILRISSYHRFQEERQRKRSTADTELPHQRLRDRRSPRFDTTVAKTS